MARRIMPGSPEVSGHPLQFSGRHTLAAACHRPGRRQASSAPGPSTSAAHSSCPNTPLTRGFASAAAAPLSPLHSLPRGREFLARLNATQEQQNSEPPRPEVEAGGASLSALGGGDVSAEHRFGQGGAAGGTATFPASPTAATASAPAHAGGGNLAEGGGGGNLAEGGGGSNLTAGDGGATLPDLSAFLSGDIKK